MQESRLLVLLYFPATQVAQPSPASVRPKPTSQTQIDASSTKENLHVQASSDVDPMLPPVVKPVPHDVHASLPSEDL